MEGLINLLKDQQNVIQRGLSNFKKSPKDRLTLEYIETRQELLEHDWVAFRSANSNLHEKYREDELGQKVIDIYDVTEDTYITYKCLMKTLINKISVVKETGQQSSSSLAKTSNSFVRLPKISIPMFSGTYGEWTTFHDLFISLVHKNDSLDNVQKLHYLKSHLSGEAEQLIRHTPITDANYIECWAQLEKRYSNKKYLANCILKRFFGQKCMQSESASLLKNLLDTTSDCLHALKNLQIDVSTWDVIIIHIVTFKLDHETRKQWELSINNDSNNELPTFKQFKHFIENRFRALECIEPTKAVAYQSHQSHQSKNSSHVHNAKAMLATSTSSMRCEFCSESHKLCFCKGFSKQSVDSRRDFVAKNKICFNCLGSNHTVYNCKKNTTCRVCNKRHHSLLHPGEPFESKVNVSSVKPTEDSTSSVASTNQIVTCLSTDNFVKYRQVLLATALIRVESKTGSFQMVRALLDQGSQACLITEAAVQYLRLKKNPIRGLVSGVGGNQSTIATYMVHLTIQSRIYPQFRLEVNAYVLSKITSYLPERNISTTTFDWIGENSLRLADPEFNKPNKIDILLGADTFSCILKEGIVKSPSGTLVAQSTTLGWVLSGTVSPANNTRPNYKTDNIYVMHLYVGEDQMLKQFWEIEDQICSERLLTPEEQRCEELYSISTKRDDDGRYIVKLPFRDSNPRCKSGNSRAIAKRRFEALERKLEKDKVLKESYVEVIQEYIQLGHLRPVKLNDSKKEEAVYLPHHAVIRNDKTTTKVRVVFNASEKNSNGVSLNDTLMVGPTLQADLRHIVLRWRVYPIGLVADIIKMYRQVKVADEDVMFQRVLWRDRPDEEIKDYELTTVTFGTASAPYQAVRTLHQIAYDEGEGYDVAAKKVLNSFYMDDFMSGCYNVEEGVEIVQQMTEILAKGGFTLQKWNSNNQQILNVIHTIENKAIKEDVGQTHKSKKEIGSNKHETIEFKNSKTTKTENIQHKHLDIKLNSTIKILGLTWDRSNDTFQYSVNLPPPTTAPVTKRSIISDIAKLFDPLGWLAPSVVIAKIFIQKLWLAGVGWDEALKTELIKEWYTYREELLLLTHVRIPRWLATRPNDIMELHGFCDASKAAYCAVVYLRKKDSADNVNISLVVAKTRVAPIKQISIPRLELCGAVLLSKLLSETAEILDISKENIRAWTDSTVVLAWLNSHPSRWKTFVANRTSEILTTIGSPQWSHISTKENPADCASRGLLPSLLIQNERWFSGPAFLKVIKYNRPKDLDINLEALTKIHVTAVQDKSIFERFSSLPRLLRVIAYCRRFLKQNKGQNKVYIQKSEIESALECCIKKTQRESFITEYTQLQEKACIQLKSSKLKSLCPYIDHKGVMRVRGRLERSQLEEQTKHPIVLSSASHLTQLIVADAHLKTLHGVLLLMTNYIRTAYWILGARNTIKKHVRKCVICIRQKASVSNQMMGSLPSVRCSPTRPFAHSGVDYAGPINVRTTKGRGHNSYKGYLCLFVCMSTRALHLEVVSDMTTQAFLAAFRRFVARRGHVAKLWSDNGTTFVGASRELQQLASIQPSIAEHLEANGTEWHFIPPHSPNFGSLWEAGVKSTKFHLKRVIGGTTLTYEELSTLLSHVEACLNSRPMSLINSEDPGEPLPLTPGHFLIGEPFVNVPDYSYEGSNVSSLTRWQLVQKMLQSFWKRWSQEYLSSLMNRYKWSTQVPEPKIGDIILIKEDDLPPSR